MDGAPRQDGQGTDLPFTFETDAARKLLVVTKWGYWDMATFAAFAETFRMTLRRMQRAGGCRYCLVDASRYAVQSRAISEALQALVESFPPDCPQRMAGVSGSQLGRLQARHHGETPDRQVFSSRADAEAWLFSDQD